MSVQPSNKPQPVERPAAADRWFCLIDGVEHGPFGWADLQSMARHHRLKPRHELKRGDDGEWEPAARFTDLFEDVPEQVQAASPKVVTPSMLAAEVRERARSEPIRGEPWGPRIRSQLARRRKLLVVAAALLVVAGLAFAYWGGFFGYTDEQYYAELAAIHDEHRALREQRADDAAWAELTLKAEALHARTVPRLRRTATRRSQQHLLWAADHLLPMIEQCRVSKKTPERKFEEHLTKARKLLDDPNSVPPDDLIEREPTGAAGRR